jgi:hypothetical protein
MPHELRRGHDLVPVPRRSIVVEGSGGVAQRRKSPGGRIAAALAVVVPVGLSGLLLVAFLPSMWWIFTTYFWIAFPALRSLGRGMADLLAGGTRPNDAADAGERELLRALARRGELTPAMAAIETSLSVSEADRMLKMLAEDGHLEVRVRGGGLSYALWETQDDNALGGKGRTIERDTPYLGPRA